MADQVLVYRFRIEPLFILKHLIGVISIVLVVSFFDEIEDEIRFLVLGLVLGYYLWTLIVNGIPLAVSVNRSENVLIIVSFKAFSTRRESYSCDDIVCSYKKEISARGSRIVVLKILDKRGKLLLRIVPNVNGWNNESLSQIDKFLNS